MYLKHPEKSQSFCWGFLCILYTPLRVDWVDKTRRHANGLNALQVHPANLWDAAGYCRQHLSETFQFFLKCQLHLRVTENAQPNQHLKPWNSKNYGGKNLENTFICNHKRATVLLQHMNREISLLLRTENQKSPRVVATVHCACIPSESEHNSEISSAHGAMTQPWKSEVFGSHCHSALWMYSLEIWTVNTEVSSFLLNSVRNNLVIKVSSFPVFWTQCMVLVVIQLLSGERTALFVLCLANQKSIHLN